MRPAPVPGPGPGNKMGEGKWAHFPSPLAMWANLRREVGNQDTRPENCDQAPWQEPPHHGLSSRRSQPRRLKSIERGYHGRKFLDPIFAGQVKGTPRGQG